MTLARLVRVYRFYKKAAAFVLRAVAKHSPDLAQAVVDSGALDALVPCLEVRCGTYPCALLQYRAPGLKVGVLHTLTLRYFNLRVTLEYVAN